MCIICVSKAGTRQPSLKEITTMAVNNPHGFGFMVARDGFVHIRKGFMDLESFITAIQEEKFTSKDSVVYHFRIATQGGINPEMTHPFPLTDNIELTKTLECYCECGVAHNGIIPVTTNRNDKEYSDTARFVAEYLSGTLASRADLEDPEILSEIEYLAQSKLAIMTGDGFVATIGKFIKEESGLLFSNYSYNSRRFY